MSVSGKAIRHYSHTLAMAFSLGCFSCGDCVETPSVSSMAPTTVTAGSAAVVLVVNGDHFNDHSTVEWNGAARSTVFVNGHQLKATVTSEDLATPATAKITVFSPPQSWSATFASSGTSSGTSSSVKMDCAGGTSNSLNFTVH